MISLCATIVTAYMAFFLGENNMGVSGVLATCGAALPFALRFLDTKIEFVWHFIEHAGNTLLFMTAGLVTGNCLSRQQLSFDDFAAPALVRTASPVSQEPQGASTAERSSSEGSEGDGASGSTAARSVSQQEVGGSVQVQGGTKKAVTQPQDSHQIAYHRE